MFVASPAFSAPAGVSAAREVAVPVLTGREREVLRLMGHGVVPSGIARLLGITVNTCRGYVKSLRAKLGVRSQLEAVVKAQRLGLVEVNRDDA